MVSPTKVSTAVRPSTAAALDALLAPAALAARGVDAQGAPTAPRRGAAATKKDMDFCAIPSAELATRIFGCCICRPSVTCSHYGFNHQFDLSCAKSIKIGAVRTGQCDDGDEIDVGLCYPKCRDGFDGVGPVCWGSAPIVLNKDGSKTNFVICGMGAAKDDLECASAIAAQISSPFMVVANIVTFGAAGKFGKTAQKGFSKVVDAAAKFGSKAKDAATKVGKSIGKSVKWGWTKIKGAGKAAEAVDTLSDGAKGVSS